MNLAEVLKTRRKKLGISQEDLAEISGVGISTVKDIERGTANPSLNTISKLLDTLGMEINYNLRKVIE